MSDLDPTWYPELDPTWGPELDPTWYPGEHLEAVYQRGRQLRRRRRTLIVSAPVFALVVLGAAVVGGSVSQRPSVVHTAARGSHQPSSASADTSDGGAGDTGPGGPGSDTAGPSGTGPAGSPAVTPSGDSGSPSSGGMSPNGGPGASASTGQTGATGGPAASPASAPGPRAGDGPRGPNSAAPIASTATPACSPSDLDYSTVTDHRTYGAGQSVTISLVVHNHANHPCDGPGVC
ncbi:MAG: hypothetical protein JOZ04_06050, partial [Acidimicrobiia bacterium]|nr:hypothetical protein [Acidimicrobiia bacterium]